MQITIRYAALCTALIFAAACDEAPTAPTADVTGAWDFSFTASDPQACAGTPGLLQGCAGSGRLDFLATTPVNATHSYRAACQSCARVADYGVFEQPLSTVRLAGDVLEFTLAACRFTTTLPGPPTQTVAGTAACRPAPADPEINGTWTMSRR